MQLKIVYKLTFWLAIISLGAFFLLALLAIEGTAFLGLPLLLSSIPLIALTNLLSAKIKAQKASITKGRQLFNAALITSVLGIVLVASLPVLLYVIDAQSLGWVVVFTAFVIMIGLTITLGYGIVIRRAFSALGLDFKAKQD